MRCPNCSYKLVFLENRLKYKCAKCSKLFPQKLIENIEFRRWNEFQRGLDKENLKPIKEVRFKLSEEEKRQKRINYYHKNKVKLLAIGLEYRKRNRSKERERISIWADNNRDEYNVRKRNYLEQK